MTMHSVNTRYGQVLVEGSEIDERSIMVRALAARVAKFHHPGVYLYALRWSLHPDHAPSYMIFLGNEADPSMEPWAKRARILRHMLDIQHRSGTAHGRLWLGEEDVVTHAATTGQSSIIAGAAFLHAHPVNKSIARMVRGIAERSFIIAGSYEAPIETTDSI